MLQINEGRSWSNVWFKPELVLPPEDKFKATELFAVEWLPYMLVGELILSVMMRKQVRTSSVMQCYESHFHSSALTRHCTPLQVYNLRQLINNLTAPLFFNLTARKLSMVASLLYYCVVNNH